MSVVAKVNSTRDRLVGESVETSSRGGHGEDKAGETDSRGKMDHFQPHEEGGLWSILPLSRLYMGTRAQ